MAQDHQSADVVIKGAHMVNVCTAEIQEDGRMTQDGDNVIKGGIRVTQDGGLHIGD